MRKDLVHLTDTDLLNLALKSILSKNYWEIVGELHRRGGREIFDQAVKWCRSSISQEEQLGASILGQLGWRKDQFRKKSIKILMQLLDDPDAKVISFAAYALGHRGAKEAVSKLAKMSKHRKAEVRLAIVYGLLNQTQDQAINTLIQLSADKSKEVRNWATFGLGSMIETDNETIRTALIQRLTDSFIDVRMEALNGLANRKDPNAIEWTLNALREDDVITGYLEAAETLSDSRLLPDLQRIKAECGAETSKTNSYFISCLDDAIAACSGKAQE